MNTNKSMVIVFRGGSGNWWRSWDGKMYQDGFNFKNSLFNCLKQMGEVAGQVGVILVDTKDDVNDVPNTFRPGTVDVIVLDNGVSNYKVVRWSEIPIQLFGLVRKLFKVSQTDCTKITFDFSDIDHYILWTAIKLSRYGVEVENVTVGS